MSDFNFDDVHVPIQEGSIPAIDHVPEGADHIEGVKGVAKYGEEVVVQEGVGYSGPDFRPSPKAIEKLREYEKTPTPEKDGITGPVYVRAGEVDFYNGKDTAEHAEMLKVRINKIAKQIYEDKSRDVEKYKKAVKFLDSLPEDQLVEPNEKVTKIMRYVKRGPPLTKEKALKLAKEQVLAMSYNQ